VDFQKMCQILVVFHHEHFARHACLLLYEPVGLSEEPLVIISA
jgi:hypothetical protein